MNINDVLKTLEQLKTSNVPLTRENLEALSLWGDEKIKAVASLFDLDNSKGISETEFEIFNRIAMLDGDNGNISEKDLEVIAKLGANETEITKEDLILFSKLFNQPLPDQATITAQANITAANNTTATNNTNANTIELNTNGGDFSMTISNLARKGYFVLDAKGSKPQVGANDPETIVEGLKSGKFHLVRLVNGNITDEVVDWRKDPDFIKKGSNTAKTDNTTKTATTNKTMATANTDNTVDNKQNEASYTVESGDTLWKIITKQYGNCNWDMVNNFIKANPSIKDPNLIYPGQVFKFPNSLE